MSTLGTIDTHSRAGTPRGQVGTFGPGQRLRLGPVGRSVRRCRDLGRGGRLRKALDIRRQAYEGNGRTRRTVDQRDHLVAALLEQCANFLALSIVEPVIPGQAIEADSDDDLSEERVGRLFETEAADLVIRQRRGGFLRPARAPLCALFVAGALLRGQKLVKIVRKPAFDNSHPRTKVVELGFQRFDLFDKVRPVDRAVAPRRRGIRLARAGKFSPRGPRGRRQRPLLFTPNAGEIAGAKNDDRKNRYDKPLLHCENPESSAAEAISCQSAIVRLSSSCALRARKKATVRKQIGRA